MEEKDVNLQEEENDELYEHHRIVADKGQAPLRIDKFLLDRICTRSEAGAACIIKIASESETAGGKEEKKGKGLKNDDTSLERN